MTPTQHNHRNHSIAIGLLIITAIMAIITIFLLIASMF